MKQLHSLIFLAFLMCPQVLFAAESDRPLVKQISAVPVSSTNIKVSWKLPAGFKAQALYIYKDTQPFATQSQIRQSAAVAKLTPRSTYYLDTVTNYKEYYYAVIARLADGTSYDIVLPSINATISGVKVNRTVKAEPVEEIEEKRYADGELRELPLPYLDIMGEAGRKPNKLNPLVMKEGRDLAKGRTIRKKTPLTPHIFDEDMISPDGGDEYYLFEVLKTSFIKRDYQKATADLRRFLSINRTNEVTMRAAFYLGESLYFTKKYRDALTMFLFVEEAYPALSKKWMQSTLDLYNLPPA